jgi:HSP20 family protein
MTSLASIQREIDQLFGRLAPEGRAEGPVAGEWFPPTDVFESRGQIVITVEVPGLTRDEVRVVYKNHRVIVTGERRERRAGAGGTVFHCMERPQGRFTRSIPLDQAIDIPHAESRLANGVLTILIPRLKDRRGRETVIPIHGEETPKS